MPPEYFKPEEVEGLNAEFVFKLNRARHAAQTPFVITSGFRTPEKNQSIVGAVADSSHLTGMAVDLLVENSHEVWQILVGLIAADINRIGIYINKDNIPTHIHCDMDSSKVSQVVFIKKEGQANSAPATA